MVSPNTLIYLDDKKAADITQPAPVEICSLILTVTILCTAVGIVRSS